ncbi:hypothetical protein [Clostridium culturomicium]|uniref:hypothetical protein n=2 Tax=Clostridium culturomicium TaxID=1499683 RepID=UPI000590AD95
MIVVMIEKYKRITKEIIDILNEEVVDHEKLGYKIDERQDLITKFKREELDAFRKEYWEKYLPIDKIIKSKLEEQIIKAKKELFDHRNKQTVSTAYVKAGKNNLNIFSKKV